MADPRLLSLLRRCPPDPFVASRAAELGLSERGLTDLLESGLLSRPLRGVLARPDLPDTLETRAAVARLVLPPGAALCRTTAAWLMGIDCRPPGEHLAVPPVDCVVPVPRRRIRRPGLRCFEADLRSDDWSRSPACR